MSVFDSAGALLKYPKYLICVFQEANPWGSVREKETFQFKKNQFLSCFHYLRIFEWTASLAFPSLALL